MADVIKGIDQTAGLMKTPDTDGFVFGGEHQAIRVTKPVNQLQLLDEIDAALGDPDKYHVVLQIDDHAAPVSKSNPLTVYVHPQDTDPRVVDKAIKAHKPQDDYGRTEEQKEISALRTKLAEGDLSLPEINKLLRSFFVG